MSVTSKRPDKARGKESEGERRLDETLEESFPASDPPAIGRRSTAAPDSRAGKAHDGTAGKRKRK